MRSRFLVPVLALSAVLAGCAGMDDDYYVAGPVAPPGKYVPEVYVPEIVTMEDFLVAAGTNTVFFDTDKAVLTPQARDVLERQALWLITHRDVFFKVEGHADSRSPSSYNLDLARRRAEAVKDFFVSKGIRSERITAVSYGEESPVIDEPGDIELNRRVVTVIE
jgi:peptidoglycan-associated lipoprotein